MEFFEAAKGQGMLPHHHPITYNALIKDCQRANQLQRALGLLETMKSQGVVPDVITYNALIGTCSQSNQSDLFLEVLREMK